MVRRLRVAVVVLSLSGAAFSTAWFHGVQAGADTVASSAESLPTGSATIEEAFEEQERARFDFDASLEATRAAAALPDSSNNPLGIPLTDIEAAQLEARDALGSAVDRVVAIAHAAPDFGGVWLAQVGYGTLHVRFSSPVTAALTRLLRAAVPSGSNLTVDAGGTTAADATSVQNAITADMPSWTAAGITLASVGADPTTGLVRVVIADGAPASAESQLADAYSADRIQLSRGPIDQETGARDIRSGALYGGEWTAGYEYCTAGYAHMINSANQYYLVLAGHCNPKGTSVVQGRAGSRTIGTVGTNSARTDGGNTYCDCEAIGPLSSALVTNEVLINANAKYRYTKDPPSYYQGQRACHTGAASYEANGGHIVCGTITVPHITVTEGTGSHADMVVLDSTEANCTSIKGDSGAPYGDGGEFLGIQNSGLGPTHFSKAEHMDLTIGVNTSY